MKNKIIKCGDHHLYKFYSESNKDLAMFGWGNKEDAKKFKRILISYAIYDTEFIEYGHENWEKRFIGIAGYGFLIKDKIKELRKWNKDALREELLK